MHLHTLFNFNKPLLSMVQNVMSSSSFIFKWWWLAVNVGDWGKFCGIFINGGCVFLCFYFFFLKSQKKNQWGAKMEYKTEKKKYFHTRERRIQRIFLLTLPHTLKWCNYNKKLRLKKKSVMIERDVLASRGPIKTKTKG